MWEGCYASEPFDLRLTVLRLIRSFWRIVLFTLLGTVIFGGGYYLRKVVLGEPPRYEMTITCKMEYTDPPVQSGDYYINEMTWNTYLDSRDFYNMLQGTMPFLAMDVTLDMWAAAEGGVDVALSAAVASDIHVPSFKVSTLARDKTEILAGAVQEVLTGTFAESIPEIASIRVINVSEPELVRPDVRPGRAVVLSAILSCFFTVVFWLLREIGADSIWLPATLRKRYGLKALGTKNSPEIKENIRYLFADKKEVAVCAVTEDIDPQEVAEALGVLMQTNGDKAGVMRAGEGQEQAGKREDALWFAVPAPILSPEAAEPLRRADGVLLVAEAGLHAGKPLEYVLEFLAAQDIPVTAALLWNADEVLIRAYYRLGGCEA